MDANSPVTHDLLRSFRWPAGTTAQLAMSRQQEIVAILVGQRNLVFKPGCFGIDHGGLLAISLFQLLEVMFQTILI